MAVLFGCFPINEEKIQFLHKLCSSNTTKGTDNLKSCIFRKFQYELWIL